MPLQVPYSRGVAPALQQNATISTRAADRLVLRARVRYETDVRLAEFIVSRMEAILVEWEGFATTLLPAAIGMDSLALRDHARQILEAVAKDLNTVQTRSAQAEKSKGRAPEDDGAKETAAQSHAVLRASSGFSIRQLVAEYRALRATVLRAWMDDSGLDANGVGDMIRFNEAIDQAVAESVDHFQASVEHHRNLLLGMVGHDMRNPLNCIVMTASFLEALDGGEQVTKAAARLTRSGASLRVLLDDLTDFNRTNLGLSLRVVPTELDLGEVAEDELDQFRAAQPQRRIEFSASGDTCGRWDGTRVQQILRNLVSNALTHGAPDSPVRVTLHGEHTEVRFEVSNSGHIAASDLGQIFDPLRRGATEPMSHEARDGMGLGLFIVRELANAHGGDVEVRSEGEQTTFAVRLPREQAGGLV